ncbi:MAG: tRNA pseudouridine(55) synthase TruB [Endomicrobiales bacterium]|nr:tRNA pseudouridine(55) synthase TruB [Endomicrobiales bacterium]
MNENGLLNINKQTGVTSYWIVDKVKKILKIRKVGHCGTLDPIAEGVLLVLFGNATKFQSQFMSMRKTYRTRLSLGVKTDTGDITGKVLNERPVEKYSYEHISGMLERFKGEIKQLTPIYSAAKYNGKRLYKLARLNMDIKRPPRFVTIHRIDILHIGSKSIELRIKCSSGTYIRSLAEDIGEALGCGATVEYLCRESVGPFNLDSAVNGKNLETLNCADLLRLSVNFKNDTGCSILANDKSLFNQHLLSRI